MNKNASDKRGVVSSIVIFCLLFLIVAVISFFSFHGFKGSDEGQLQAKKINEQKSELLEKFYLPAINGKLGKIGLTDLKNEVIPEGAKEVRIWVGFSHYGFRGVALKDNKASWSAIYIPAFEKTAPPSSNEPRPLSPPKSGWQELSVKLQEIGLYDLQGEPDKVPGRQRVTDAIAVVIEIKTSSSYKACLYQGVSYYKGEEIEKVESIIKTLSSEFEIELY